MHVFVFACDLCLQRVLASHFRIERPWFKGAILRAHVGKQDQTGPCEGLSRPCSGAACVAWALASGG